jgi:hypothetical protein
VFAGRKALKRIELKFECNGLPKRVPADIADIEYSGPVRGYAHKLWNLPEALHFRLRTNAPGVNGIEISMQSPDAMDSKAFFKNLLTLYHGPGLTPER